jgi:hypothetical protein
MIWDGGRVFRDLLRLSMKQFREELRWNSWKVFGLKRFLKREFLRIKSDAETVDARISFK